MYLPGLVSVYFYFLTVTLTELVSGSREEVTVENYSFPVELGKFIIFEQSADKVILQEYPAFYYEGEEFKLETPIQNSKNQTIGYIIGQDKYYYPITPRKEKMYCGHYDIDALVENRDIFYRQIKFSSIEALREKIQWPKETLCFIYV